MSDKLSNSIVEAAKQTISALGTTATPEGDPVTEPGSRFDADTSVVISIEGEIKGALALRCSQTLACELAGLMLGIEIDPGSEDMKDAIGELFNMVVGSMKRFLVNDHDPFSISVPTTIIGADHTIHVNATDNARFLRVRFTCNGHEFAIEAYVDR